MRKSLWMTSMVLLFTALGGTSARADTLRGRDDLTQKCQDHHRGRTEGARGGVAEGDQVGASRQRAGNREIHSVAGADASVRYADFDSSDDSEVKATGTPTVTVASTTYATLGAPFEAVVSCSGTVFVSVSDDGTPGSKTGVQVFTPTDGSLQSTCVNELPSWLLSEGAAPANLDFLPHRIDIAGGIGDPGAIFYNVAALQSCAATGFVVSQGPLASFQGTLAVKVTPDEKYAFVSNEYGVANGATTEGNIGVVQLHLDANGDVTTGTTLIGQISTGGNAIAGMTLSPDGTRLYVTSEVADRSTSASGGSNPVLARTGCVQNAGGKGTINGLLTVIDVATAETTPGPAAVLATIDAGCWPVRMAESRDESALWVAVRGDDRVLAFSPLLLESNPDNALLGYASTGGTAPVGVALFHNDKLLAVANSNRFNTGTANATILYVAAPATATVVQTIATGLFPREITVGSDDGTLYLTNYNSDTFQVIETTVAPRSEEPKSLNLCLLSSLTYA